MGPAEEFQVPMPVPAGPHATHSSARLSDAERVLRVTASDTQAGKHRPVSSTHSPPRASGPPPPRRPGGAARHNQTQRGRQPASRATANTFPRLRGPRTVEARGSACKRKCAARASACGSSEARGVAKSSTPAHAQPEISGDAVPGCREFLATTRAGSRRLRRRESSAARRRPTPPRPP